MAFTVSGWLDKRGGLEATKGWKKRWCILSNHVLRYYKSASDTTPAGTIFAEDIVDVVPDEDESKKDSKHGFVFKLVTKGRDYLLNAPSLQMREEWIKKIKSLLQTHRSEESVVPDVYYATVDIFVNRGLRVTGQVNPMLLDQLTTTAAKTHRDERGWFSDQALPHASVLNLFTQHGWTLATAFQSNSIPPNSTSIAPSDTMIFTHTSQ